jgi:hypothetical protein
MQTECLCDSQIKSLYQKQDCKSFLKKAVNVLPILRKGGGVKNFIDISAIPVPETTFQSMFQDADPSKRLHAIYDIKNTSFAPQDGATEDWQDGTSSKLRDGNLQMVFIVPETGIDFIGSSKDLECKSPDLFLYLADGSIVGYADRDTIASDQKVYPLPVENWSIVESPLTTDEGVAKVEVTVNFSNSMDYNKWIVISPSENDFDETANYEPIGANLSLAATTTTTTLNVQVNMNGFGVLGNSVPISALAVPDFSLTSNLVSEAILTVTEVSAGLYIISFQSQTSGDSLVLSLASASGYSAPVLTELVP